ncbi:hypothetical protein [Variovorax soli]|uniref:hypothetical protein n=1 Tax=Variovorax soli TaxID=376815 RepID=UPI000837C476|nr:hypothetical protein [Variovorax soli]
MEKQVRFNVLEGKLASRREQLFEFASEEQKAQYEESTRERREMLDRLRKNIVEQPEKVFPAFLKMLVDDPESMQEAAPSAVRLYSYVAKHLLSAIEGAKPEVGEHLTFEQFCVEEAFYGDKSIYFRLFNFDEDRPFESIFEELLSDRLDHFRNAAASACHMVWLGVPMYLAGPDGTLTEDRSSERFHFIKGMGKYFYPPNDYEAPEWMNGVYLKRSDIDRHYLIFSQPETPSAEEQAALIKAYRVSLNLPLDEAHAQQELGFGTRLARYAGSMIEHFEKQGFSRVRTGEWPLQKAVVHWLSTSCGLSNREAEAIDLMTRPDHLRVR